MTSGLYQKLGKCIMPGARKEFRSGGPDFQYWNKNDEPGYFPVKTCKLWHIFTPDINGKKKTVDNSLNFAAKS
jgi:hypothetical protein